MQKKAKIRFELDTLYMVAMLKIQHELSRIEDHRFEKLLAASLAELGIKQEALEDYLRENRESLIMAAQTVGI